MAALDSNKTYQNLLRKGFRIATNKSLDHKWVEFWFEGKLTKIKTKMSHGKKEIDENLISLMSRQTYLSSRQFRLLAECTITDIQYIEILKQRNIL